MLFAALSGGCFTSGGWSFDKSIKIWDCDYNCIQILTYNDWISSIAILEDERIVFGTIDGIIGIWDRTDDCVKTLNEHIGNITNFIIRRYVVSFDIRRSKY